MEKRITGKTSLYSLIGSPVDHSGSPAMYNYSFEKTGVDAAYLAFDISLEELPDAIAAIKTLKIKGSNVTMPCKSEALKFMDELSPAARIVGAINTMVNENGKLTGHITDGVGFIRNLKEHGVEVKNKKITILGAGGAGTAIQVQCALDGAREISVFNIKDVFYDNALETAKKINMEVPDCIVNVFDLEDTEKLSQEIAGSDILVNSTKVGMHPDENISPIQDVNVFRKNLVVADTVYNPKVTKLLMDAETAGSKTVGGIGMLLWQGAEAFNIYTGLEMPAQEVNELFFK
ncbi:MAG: shikimate dehydrogenase [Eubacteriaceae bacterium]|nr:shikimate dehydrogenase [Eubacteriaceae bacterium]